MNDSLAEGSNYNVVNHEHLVDPRSCDMTECSSSKSIVINHNLVFS